MLLAWLALGLAQAAPSARVVATAARSLGLDASDPRVSVGGSLDWRGGTLVRFEQRFHGLDVDGDHLVALVGPDGSVRRAGGVPAAEPDADAARPRLPAAQATEWVEALSPRLGMGRLWAPRSTLVWLVAGAPAPILAWRVDHSTASPPAVFSTWIDAAHGGVLRTDLRSRSARGRVYPSNPVLSEPDVVELAGLEVGATLLEGEYTSTSSCDRWTITEGLFGISLCDAWSPHAVADEGGDFLFDPLPSSYDDPLAEVQVYHHVDLVARTLATTYGFQVDPPMRSYVNFELANAFYGDFDGDGASDVSFGQDGASGVDLGYDADVVYHEFGHSVVDHLASLPYLRADEYGMEWVSGSINEGFADVLAMVLTGDARVGEYAGTAFERDAIRDLEVDRRCPDDLKGEVHADGEILGALAWNLAQDPRLGPQPTLDLFLGALPFWGPDVTWPSVGTSLLDSAAALLDAGALDAAGADAVAEHVDASNVVDCGRTIPLDDGREVTLYLLNGGLLGDLERIPAGVQLTLEVPPDAASLEFEVIADEGHPGVGWALYGNPGGPVRHEVTSIDALGLAVAIPDPEALLAEGDGPATVAVQPTAERPVAPGDTWHFVLASRNVDLDFFDFEYSRVTAAAHAVPAEPPPPDEGGGGCGCTHRSGAPPWLLLTLLGPWLRRSRGTRRSSYLTDTCQRVKAARGR